MIGDSHVKMLNSIEAQQTDGEIVFHMVTGASFTAYSLGDHQDEILDWLAGIDKSCWVISLYGEIDCRYQIFYHHQVDNASLDEVIERTVLRYLDFVQSLISREYKMIVSSIMPTMRVGMYDGDPLLILPHGHGSSDETRRYIAEVFNAKLKFHCWKLGIPYLNLYPYLVDPVDGLTRADLALSEQDWMHYRYIGDIATKVIKETLWERLCT